MARSTIFRSSIETLERTTEATSNKLPNQCGLLPALELVNLSKSFGKYQAVSQLFLEINQGEIFGLLGPNGSGKTTTLNMLCGLSVPSSGSIRVLGYNPRRQSHQVRELLGMVPQETALYDDQTAWENLAFHADLFGLSHCEKRARIAEILELMQLSGRAHSFVKTFSGGMKRRLALGRALLHHPRLLYLDEPTVAVDPQARRAIWDHILALRDQGKTILLTTNYLEEAQALCDRVAILDQGKLLVVDTPDHLRREHGGSHILLEIQEETPLDLTALRSLPGVREASQVGVRVTVHTRGPEIPLTAIIRLVGEQRDIRDVEVHEADLDEVFLRLTGSALRD